MAKLDGRDGRSSLHGNFATYVPSSLQLRLNSWYCLKKSEAGVGTCVPMDYNAQNCSILGSSGGSNDAVSSRRTAEIGSECGWANGPDKRYPIFDC